MADIVDPFATGAAPAAPAIVDPFAAPAQPVAPPAPEHNAFGEIGAGFARGALVDLPQMAGQALQYAGANHVGGMVRGFGTNMASAPWLQLNPQQHGAIVNALATGAEQVAPVVAPVAAAAGAALAAPVELPGAAVAGLGAAAGGALAAGSAGQQTLEKAQAKGVAPAAAQTAARLNAATTFATQFGLGMIGGHVIGAAGGALGRVVGAEAAPAAADVLSQLSGTSSALGQTARAALTGGAEAVGVGAAQAAASAGIEQHYGIDNTSPMQAALATIPAMLGMTAILTPFGLASRAIQARVAADRTATLGAPETAPAVRTQLADQYATAIEQQSGNGAAARAFSENAQRAIDQGLPLNVSPELFNQEAVQTATQRNPMAQAAAVPQLPAPVRQLGNLPPGQLYTMPDGSTTRDFSVVENYVNGLPPDQQDAARAQIFGFAPNTRVTPSATPEAAQANADSIDAIHQQLVQSLQQNGVEPAAPMTRQQFAADRNIGGQRAVQEYQQYLADPATQEAVMRENIAKYEQMQAAEANKPPVGQAAVKPSLVSSAPPEAQNPLGLQLSDALRQRQVDQAYAQLDAQRDQERQAIANRTYGGMEADQANALIAQHESDLETLHGQVNAALRDAGIKPQEVKEGESPDVAMRANADRYQQLLDQQAAEQRANAASSEGTPAVESSEQPQLNTQLRDQMQAALRQYEIDQAYQQHGAGRESDLNMMGNQADAARLAAAAEAGTIKPDANAPKTAENITTDIDAVNKANDFDTKAQSMVPFRKRLDALGLDQLPTHQDQIDTLQAYLSDATVKMGAAARDRMSALLDSWKADMPEPETPASQETPTSAPTPTAGNETISPEAAPALAGTPAPAAPTPQETPISAPAPAAVTGLPPNMPVTADADATQPAQADTLGENVTQSAQSHAQDTADMVDAALAQFNTRLRNGEQLAPLEQERMEDLQGMRRALAEVTSGNNVSDSYAQDVSNMAREAATTPYTQSYRHYRTDNPEAIDPGIMLDALRTGRLQDTLNTIAANSTTDHVRALAQRIAPLVPDTSIRYAAPDGTGAAGEYLPATNRVHIFPGGESEQTILHEAVHAAQQAQVARAEAITTPRTQAEARLKQAYNEIESIRQEVATRTGSDAYGLTNAHEFLAELNTNPDFQQLLKDAQTQGRPSLWTRAVGAVKRLLGVQQGGDFLERAMTANEAFFRDSPQTAGFPLPRASEVYRRFMRSPAGAGAVTDEQFSKMKGLVDAVRDVDFSKLNMKLFRASLGWKTVQFIADRVRALPEMVQSGFAAGVDAYQHAQEQHRIATGVVEHPVGQYADSLRKLMLALKDANKARDLGRQMMTIAGESSRGGFDYRMNYADNVKAGRDIPAANKGYVDDIHRQFMALRRSNPDAAKAIETGELMNGRLQTMKAATLMRNLINAAGDATMAAHAARLDFMAADLKNARNPDPAHFADGMTAALHARLTQAFADARAKLPKGSVLRDNINQLADMYNAQRQTPYFSLGRDGDYFVKVGFQNMDEATQAKLQAALKGSNKVLGNLMDGADHAFFRVRTMDEAVGLYNKLLQAGGDRIAPNTGAYGKLADRLDSAYGVSPALRSLLGSLHETIGKSGLTGDAATAARDTITRELLSMLPETSSRNALMQRRGIPGYDADFLGNFARRAQGGVQDTANMHAMPALMGARKQMEAAIDGLNRTGSDDGRLRAQLVADEINKRLANSQKPLDNTVVNTINSLGHTFYLAASPAYLIRTTAQPFHRGLPIVGARYGFVPAAREIARSTAVALRVMQNTIGQGYSADGMRGVLDANTQFRNLGLSARDEAFVQELHDRGVMNLGQARQLQSMALGGSQLKQDITRMAGMTAQYAEMTNRLAVGLAAFRLAERAKPGDAGNIDWAIQTIDRAMDNFDPSNTARLISKHGFAGPVTPLLTAFMNYNLQTMQQIARTVHDGLFNRDQSPAGLQRAREARREFGGLMATTAMISGVMGLPFANVFAGVYNTIMDELDPDNPHDIRIDTQKFLENHLGHTLGDVVSHGIPRAWGFDSSTFGLENLLPGSEFLSSRQLLQDRLDSESSAMLGPALDAGISLWEAADKFSDGYYVKGIEEALPSGLKPYFKAAELATRGYTDSKGNPIGISATPWDIGLQAVGFRSAKAATQSENAQWAAAREDRLQRQRNLIEDQFYKGVSTGDTDTLQTAADRLMQYDITNPTEPIQNIEQGIAQRMTGLALARATGTGVNMTVRQFPALVQQLLWAEPPPSGGGMP